VRPANAAAVAVELRALAAVGGLGDATEELSAYFEDPDAFLRTRTPTVISTLVTTARAAVAEAKLPRAMALADRASALAPSDPSVTALIQTVTEGGRSSRRKRGLALCGLAVALVGSVTALGWKLARSPVVSRTAPAPRDTVALDAALAQAIAAPDAPDPPDASLAPAEPVVPVVALDAGEPPSNARISPPRPLRDAAVRRARDLAADPPVAPADAATAEPVATGPGAGGELAVLIDAALPIDAAPVEAPPVERATAPGRVVVKSNLWCNIFIDGALRGNQRNEPIEVPAGHHVVRCVNPAGEWKQEVDITPGTTRTVEGTLQDVEVTLGVDATIDGKRYERGAVVKLKPGNVEVIVGGTKQFITFRSKCTLRDIPELGCYL
jgi:hypothetical protein